VLPRSILLLIMVLAGTGPARPAALAKPDSGPFLYTAARSYNPLAWMHGADRFPSGAMIFVRAEQGEHALVQNFASSADPAVSFDGLRVLFSGKAHAQDPWQIWEQELPAGSPHRVSPEGEECIRPFYLPDERAVYACKTAGKFTIEVSDLSGAKPMALTYGPSNFLPTDVLHDGRILFEAGYPLGTDITPELYEVYSDGSGVESYRCDHGSARYAGRQSSSGDIIFASAHGLGRFTSARAQQLPITAPAGEYAGDIIETASGDWLLSWRPNSKSYFRLMRWNTGAKELQPVLEDANGNVLEPTSIAPRSVPNRHPSGLHDWNNANLLCLNAYTSKYPFAAGSIHSVRMYARDSSGDTKLLGTAPVEKDGSFFVQVPTEQALQIELLDSTGKTLKREAGFFYMRRGEQRGCVGCHAGPETAPENAVPQSLLKSTTPADMTGNASQNASGGH
jgi:Hydrazine synthase alpha subunit middle domain